MVGQVPFSVFCPFFGMTFWGVDQVDTPVVLTALEVAIVGRNGLSQLLRTNDFLLHEQFLDLAVSYSYMIYV